MLYQISCSFGRKKREIKNSSLFFLRNLSCFCKMFNMRASILAALLILRHAMQINWCHRWKNWACPSDTRILQQLYPSYIGNYRADRAKSWYVQRYWSAQSFACCVAKSCFPNSKHFTYGLRSAFLLFRKVRWPMSVCWRLTFFGHCPGLEIDACHHCSAVPISSLTQALSAGHWCA